MDCKDKESGRLSSDKAQRQNGEAPIYELKVVREPSRYDAATYLKSPKDIYSTFRERYEKLDREEFTVILLDNKNRMLGYSIVSLGSLTASVVHPREVIKGGFTNGLENCRERRLVGRQGEVGPEGSCERGAD